MNTVDRVIQPYGIHIAPNAERQYDAGDDDQSDISTWSVEFFTIDGKQIGTICSMSFPGAEENAIAMTRKNPTWIADVTGSHSQMIRVYVEGVKIEEYSLEEVRNRGSL
jgi:hypothetical protein